MNRYKYIDEKREHLHTLDGKPLIGTSTATKIIAKPLTWWASGMACMKFGWLNPKKFSTEAVQAALDEGYARIMELDKESYAKLLTEAYRAHNDHKEKKADEGTDRHAALEKYVKLMIQDQGGKPILMNRYEDPAVQAFAEWAQKNIRQLLWSEMHGYSEVLWTGGIADVGWIDLQGRIIAGDFKSGGPYFDQFVQIAGYDLMLAENGGLDKYGNKMFELPGEVVGYCVLPFATPKFEPYFQYATESYRNGFRSAVQLSKLQAAYGE